MISTYVHLINQYGPLFPHLSTLLTSMNHDFLIKSYEIPMKSGRPCRFYRRGDLLGAQTHRRAPWERCLCGGRGAGGGLVDAEGAWMGW